MLSQTIVQFFALVGLAAAADTYTPNCSAAQRLASAQQVIIAYGSNPLQTFSEFDKIPFGVPNKAGGCVTSM